MTHNHYLLIAAVLLSLVVLSGCNMTTDTGCKVSLTNVYCGVQTHTRWYDGEV